MRESTYRGRCLTGLHGEEVDHWNAPHEKSVESVESSDSFSALFQLGRYYRVIVGPHPLENPAIRCRRYKQMDVNNRLNRMKQRNLRCEDRSSGLPGYVDSLN